MIFGPTGYKGELISYRQAPKAEIYLDFRYVAEFFICPNNKCQKKFIPDSGTVFVNAYGSNKKPRDLSRDIQRTLMTCTKCSTKGFFSKKAFCQFKCGLCHNNIILQSDGDVWFSCFGTIGHHQNGGNDFVMVTPIEHHLCNSCNTMNVDTYIPKLESYNRGIVFSDSIYVEWKDRSTFSKIQHIIFTLLIVLVLLMLFILIW